MRCETNSIADGPFSSAGELPALCRALRWEETPLGPVELWAPSLRAAVRICLDARTVPMAVWAGPELAFVYNEGYLPVLGPRHPWALGRPAREVWTEFWDRLGAELRRVMDGESTRHEDARFLIRRGGGVEEAFFTYAFTPIRGEDGRVIAALNVFHETTARVRSEAQLASGVARDATGRRRAEEALRVSEEKFAKAFHGSTAAMALSRLRDGTFIEVNDRYLELSRFSREDLVGRHGRQLRIWKHPEDRERFVREIARHGTVRGAEFQFLRADGEEWTGLLSSQVSELEGEPVLISSIIDVTAARRAEEALRASEALARRRLAELEALYETAPIGLCTFDENLRWVRVNRVIAEINGVPIEDHIGRTPSEVAPDVGEQAEEALRTILRTGERLDFEMHGTTSAQPGVERFWSEHWVPIKDGAGRVVGISVAAEEITERRRAAQALAQSEERFRTLADAMPQVVWTARSDGTVDFYNDRVKELGGVQRRGDGTWAWEPVLHPDDAGATIAAWNEAVRTGNAYEVTHRVKRADGTWHWFLSRGVPVRDDEGRVVRWFGTATDIDAQKRAEEALREADRHKNEFLAMLSHELRNPLAPIRNSLYILERAAAGGQQARRAHEVIGRQVVHLTRLVDDLLDVTRISRGKIHLQRERVELCDLVLRTAEDHRSIFDACEIALEVRCAEPPLHAHGDPARLSQAVGNLLSNAVKFTRRGGRVVLSLAAERGSAVVRVRDDGAGIAPDMIERLFQPFVQADTTLDRSKGGLGLGLALVKGLVELHGGTVSARSDGPGTGAEFVVTLPLGEARAAAPRDGAGARARSAGTPMRILVIEDNEDAAETLKEALELDGHEVETAATGYEGLEVARAFGPEVVLCDIGLPGIDGFEVARRMRADPALRDASLVALTGYTAPEDLARAREAGFAQHIAKPPDLAALESALSEIRAAASPARAHHPG